MFQENETIKDYKVIWEPTESLICENDTMWDEDYPEFTQEQRNEMKDEYYGWGGDFWHEPDYLTLPGKKLSVNQSRDAITFIEIGEEIIINDYHEIIDKENQPLIDQMLIDFFNNFERTWETIWCGNHINPLEQPNWNDERYTIQYRGGKGMHYYTHQYRLKPIKLSEYQRPPPSSIIHNYKVSRNSWG